MHRCPNCGFDLKDARARRQAEARARRQAEIVSDYKRTNSVAETGHNFGISRERVRQILHKNGIVPRTRKEVGRARSMAVDALILQLHGKGLKTRDIANASGFAETTVGKSLARQGLRPNSKISPRTQTALRLFDEGASVKEIANVLGYGEASCRALLHRYGRTITTRLEFA